MKKLLVALIAVGVFFACTMGASAATLYRTSSGNGAVKLTIKADDGYVGALDTTMKLSGEVTLDTIEWDESLAPEYVKEYTYDEATKTIRFFIATGDVTKNLADKDGNITIGVIKVTSQAPEANFNVEMNQMSVTNMDYETRSAKEIVNDKTNDFTFELEDANQPDDNQPSNPDVNNGSINDGIDGNGGTNVKDSALADTSKEKTDAISNAFGKKPIQYNSETGAYGFAGSQNNTLVYSILGIIVVAFIGGVGYMVYKQKENTETK
ncbi:MAG: hypothetical protein HFF02_02005 [Erysipelotrichaceae bacterium]|jgi:hypothetical protein|nr:hypothetical protein [Erysipelotrichaceae bacterium]